MLEQQIEDLNVSQAADAVKNLRLTLGMFEPQLENQSALQALQAIDDPAVSALLAGRATGAGSQLEWERWYKALLLLALTSGFKSQVCEAVEDALHSSSKDMNLGEPAIFAALLILLKWRPTTLEISKEKLKITWRENDVGILQRLLEHFGIGLSK